MQTNYLKQLAMFLALASLTAFAQRRQPPDPATMVQNRVNMLTTKLGLSTSQQEQATTIFGNAMNGLQPLHEQMQAAHQALQTAVSKGDNAGIDQASSTIGNLTSQMTAAHAKANVQFMQILNSDQQAKFTQILSEGPGQGFGGGFGHGRPRQ